MNMRRKIKSLICIFILTCTLSIYHQAQAASVADIPTSFTFAQTLYPNKSYDPDVKYLQLLLNTDSRTVVATQGSGSNDSPTIYYGSKTRDAVNRFQMLYRDEILTPAGLSSPTGIVGKNTRLKLNSILSTLGSSFSLNQNTMPQPSTTQTDNSANQSNQSSGAFRFVVTGGGDFVEGIDGDTTLTNGTGQNSASTTDTTSSSGIVEDTENTYTQSQNQSAQSSQGNTTNQASTSTNSNSTSASGKSSGSSNSSTGASSASASAASGAGKSTTGASGSGSTGGGSGGKIDYFGGTISNVTYCTCSLSVMLDIKDYVTGYVSLLYTPGVSTLYSNYNIFTSGPYVIGGYTQGGAQCLVYSGEECNTEGSPTGIIDTIRGIGSSGL